MFFLLAVLASATTIPIIERPQFRPGSAKLRPESVVVVDVAAEVLVDRPEVARVEVQGHTGDRGSAAHNQRLSEKRANVVRAMMIERGVAPERLVAVGYGETRPIATNDSREGRAQNARVEFVVMEAGGS